MATTEKPTCPSCKKEFESGTLFCQDDGTKLSLSSTDTKVGRLLNDRYEILHKIGEGGMGAVYKAKQLSTQKLVAIKMIAKEHTQHEQTIKRFQREVSLQAKLDHPNIVPVIDFAETPEGDYYFVMAFVEGISLKQMILENGPFSLDTFFELAIQICDGVQYAHTKGVIHRDIKGENIIVISLEHQHIAKILDFGVAKPISLHGTVRTELTMHGVTIGTPDYMSPEQAKGEMDKIGPRSDLYSIGILFYHMLTAKLPFESSTPWSIMHKHIYETPAAIQTYNSNVSQELAAIISKCLQKNPDDRYPSVLGLKKALSKEASSLQSDLFSQTASDTKTGRLDVIQLLMDSHKERQKKPFPWAFAGIGTLVVLIVAGLLWKMISDSSLETGEASPFPPKMTQDKHTLSRIPAEDASTLPGQTMTAPTSAPPLTNPTPESSPLPPVTLPSPSEQPPQAPQDLAQTSKDPGIGNNIPSASTPVALPVSAPVMSSSPSPNPLAKEPDRITATETETQQAPAPLQNINPPNQDPSSPAPNAPIASASMPQPISPEPLLLSPLPVKEPTPIQTEIPAPDSSIPSLQSQLAQPATLIPPVTPERPAAPLPAAQSQATLPPTPITLPSPSSPIPAATPANAPAPTEPKYAAKESISLLPSSPFSPPLSILWKWSDKPQIARSSDDSMRFYPTDTGTLLVGFSEETVALSKDSGKLLWRFLGDATPNFYSSNAYLWSKSPAISCLDLTTGQQKWKLKIGFNSRFDQFGSRLYVHSKMENTDSSPWQITALDLEKGKVLWNSRLDTDAYGFENGEGHFLSLIYTSRIATLDPMSGVVKWKHQTSSPLFPEPVLSATDPSRMALYAASGKLEDVYSEKTPESNLSKIDPSNGAVLWTLPLKGQPALFYPNSPVGVLMTWGQLKAEGASGSRPHSWIEKSHFNTFDPGSGKILSDIELEGFCGAHALKNAVLYTSLFPEPPLAAFPATGKTSPGDAAAQPTDALLFNPEIAAFDVQQGIILWKALPSLPDPSPVKKLHVEQNVLIVEFESGDLFAFDAKIGKPLWEAHYSLGSLFDLAFFRETLILRSPGGDILCLNLKNGQLLWRYTIYPYQTMFLLGDLAYLISVGQQAEDASWLRLPFVNAINPQNGEILWRQQIEGEIKDMQHGNSDLWVATKTGDTRTLYCFGKEESFEP